MYEGKSIYPQNLQILDWNDSMDKKQGISQWVVFGNWGASRLLFSAAVVWHHRHCCCSPCSTHFACTAWKGLFAKRGWPGNPKVKIHSNKFIHQIGNLFSAFDYANDAVQINPFPLMSQLEYEFRVVQPLIPCCSQSTFQCGIVYQGV